MTIRTYSILPAPVTGYVLDDQFSIVAPVARTNLVANPSFETNTTSWTAIGGSIARSTSYQYHGAYSLAITPTATTTDGVRYDTVSLTSGTTYAYSVKVLGIAGKSYKLSIETTGGAELSSVTFTATGRWQWVFGYYTEASSTTRRLTLRKAGGAETSIFYVDGAQVEAIGAGETVSTYIDGDQQGLVPNQYPPAFIWVGTPHASMSQRSGQTRAGGMVVKFSKFNFLLTAIVGLGMAIPQNVGTEYARIDGAYDDYTRKPTRTFSLAGQFDTRAGYFSLRQQRGGLARLLDRDLVGLDQEAVLLRDVVDECGQVDSTTCRLQVKYQDGLGGNTDNQAAEAASIQFSQNLPMIMSDGEQGASLAAQASVANANNLLYVAPNGTLQVFGSGGNLTAAAVLFGNDTYLYVGGNFSSFNGVAGTRGIARIDTATGTVSAMGTGGPNPTSVNDLAKGPDGHIWVVGNFASMGGAANSGGVAEWTGSAWAGHTYPGTTNVFAATFDAVGNLYVGNVSGTVYKWNGSAWTLLGTGTGASPTVRGITIGPDGYLYVTGSFDSINSVANTARIARYTLSAASPAWQALNGTAPYTGLANSVFYHTTFGFNGALYITMTDGTNPDLYVWNGTNYTSIAGITASGSGSVQTAITMADGLIAIGGRFDKSNGVTLADGAGFWNGATFVPFNVDFPGTTTLLDVAQRYDGALAYGFNTTGTATAAATTTATNTGTAKTYPTLRITGPSSGTSRIYELRNLTTGRSIYLNYTINAGETALLQFTPDNLSFASNFQGNIASKILPGSNEADFFLQPGANTMSFFAADSSVAAVLYWRPTYVSLDDVP